MTYVLLYLDSKDMLERDYQKRQKKRLSKKTKEFLWKGKNISYKILLELCCPVLTTWWIEDLVWIKECKVIH